MIHVLVNNSLLCGILNMWYIAYKTILDQKLYNFKFRTLLALTDDDCKVTDKSATRDLQQATSGDKSATNWPSSWKFCVDFNILLHCEIKLTPCARVVRKYTRYSLPNHLPRCRLIIKNAICDSLISISQGLKDDWSSSTYVTILCKCWTSLNSFTWTFFSRKDGQHHWSPRVGLP